MNYFGIFTFVHGVFDNIWFMWYSVSIFNELGLNIYFHHLIVIKCSVVLEYCSDMSSDMVTILYQVLL